MTMQVAIARFSRLTVCGRGIRRHRSRSHAWWLFIAAALILGGCTATVTGDPETDSSGEIPAEAEGLPPVEDISWEDCTAEITEALGEELPRPLSFECATTEVPADYTDPDTDMLELAILRAVSTAPDRDRIGSLLVNPGGPGASGLDAAVTQALMLPDEMLASFDIVGFDPRGVGASSPVVCVDDAFKDELYGADPTPASDEELQDALDRSAALVDGCEAASGEALGSINTSNTAQDMDRLREALGDEQLTYLGYSYGTTLGSTYAELFPDRVRALVLDGAVDPSTDPVEKAEAQAAGFEQAFDAFAQACVEQGAACPLGADPRQFVTDLVAAAEQTPIPQASGDPRMGTAGFVLNGVLAALYDQEAWPLLAEALALAAAGDATGIIALADAINGRTDMGYTNQLDANAVINCNDYPTPISEEDIAGYVEDWAEQYPLFGAFSATTGLSTCVTWDTEGNPVPDRDAAGADPILVIGTEGDPATPYEGAEVMADQLESGVLLTWEGEGHTAFPKTECITAAVVSYFIDLTVPEEGTTCPA